MYLDYYNLKSKPFQINIEQKFFWSGKSMSTALLTLKKAILKDNGFFILTGDTGAGKTVLINYIENILEDKTIIASIPNPDFEPHNFLNLLANCFKMNRKFESKGAFLINLRNFLQKAYTIDKKVLLIIDEAHRLKREILRELDLLSNIKIDNKTMINILLVGQNGLNQLLKESYSKAIKQNIIVRCNLGSMTKNETGRFIRYRLKIAGTERKIFNSKAVREVFSFSKGNPRLINSVCDFAMATGYSNDIKIIDAAVIKKCSNELILQNKNINRKIGKEVTAGKTAHKTGGGIKYIITSKPIIYFSIFALLLFITGYIVFNLKSEDTPRWTIDDLTPNKYKMALKEGKDAIIAELPGKNGLKGKQSVGAKSLKKPAQKTKFQASFPDNPDDIEGNKGVTPNIQSFSTLSNRKLVIYFAYSSNEIPDKALKMLNKIAVFMTSSPKTEIIIKGYTDSSGTYSFNVNISKFRADTIKSYLVGKGADPLKIRTYGMGPKNPIMSNKTLHGRKLNRRVEIKINTRPKTN
jgi:general secretion pathway protein A